MKVIWHWLILSLALYVASALMPRGIAFHPMYVAFVVGACLYFVNTTIRPIIGVLTLAANLLTLGIFSFIINGAILWLLSYVVAGFYIANFETAMIASIVVSILHWVLEIIF